MYYVKRYGILVENPKINMDSFKSIINKIISMNLIPIVILQDGHKLNSFLTVKDKITALTNWFPGHLRDDNILVMPRDFNFFENRQKWAIELKKLVHKIDARAFGTSHEGTNDKLFIVNLNNSLMVFNRFLFIDNFLDSVIKELFNIADVLNIKSSLDNKIGLYDPYLDYLFRDRTFDEIYFDENMSNVLYGNVKTKASNKAYIILEDSKYIDLMRKYSLGNILFSTYKSEFNVENEDLEGITKFLTKNNVSYNLETNHRVSTNSVTDYTKVILLENEAKPLYGQEEQLVYYDSVLRNNNKLRKNISLYNKDQNTHNFR